MCMVMRSVDLAECMTLHTIHWQFCFVCACARAHACKVMQNWKETFRKLWRCALSANQGKILLCGSMQQLVPLAGRFNSEWSGCKLTCLCRPILQLCCLVGIFQIHHNLFLNICHHSVSDFYVFTVRCWELSRVCLAFKDSKSCVLIW